MSEHAADYDALVEKGAAALFDHFHSRESRWGTGKEWPAPEQHLPWWRAAASSVIDAMEREFRDRAGTSVAPGCPAAVDRAFWNRAADALAKPSVLPPDACASFEGLRSGPCVVCGQSLDEHLPPRVQGCP